MQPNNIKIILFGLVILSNAYGAPEKDYQEGKKLAEKLKSNVPQPNQARQNHPAPAYIKESEKHAAWQRNTTLKDKELNTAATQGLVTENVAQTLINTNNKRPRVQQLVESPLIKRGLLLESRAQEILAIKGKAFVEKTNKVTNVECEASRNAEKFQCIRYLRLPKITVVEEKTENISNHLGCFHRRNERRGYSEIFIGDQYRPASVTYHGNGVVYAHATIVHPRKVLETEDSIWVSDCQHLEARIKKNECKLIKTECLDKEPKTIEGETITRECWKYQDTYGCQYPCLNNCGPYLKQGCKHVGSECKFEVNGKCYIWKQRLECPDKTIEEVKDINNAKWFGINGECGGLPYENNNEFASSIAELSVFGELHKEIQGGINNLFRGQNNQCRKTGWGVKDCCEKLRGWGTDFKLTSCNEEEQLLAEKRYKNLCHEVGEYNTEKALLVIPKKKTSFCCFTSKLARILHEQGRGQLGIGWGSAESPDCRGLTVDELSRLNFEQMNFSELFADIVQKVKPIDTNKLNLQIKDKFNLLESGTVKQEDRRDA